MLHGYRSPSPRPNVNFQLSTQMSNATDILAADTAVNSTFPEVGRSGTDFIVQTLRQLDSQTRSFVRQQQDAIKTTHAEWNECDSSPAMKRNAEPTVQHPS